MVAALIIAAGKTARENSFQPLAEVGTIPAIQRIVMVFQRAGIERIVVICDDHDSKIEAPTAHMNLVYLPGCKDAEMFDNVKVGLAYLSDKCAAAMITHVGVPLFSVETVHALISAEGAVRTPSHHGKAGHPMLLSSENFSAILSYSGDGGLAGAVKTLGLQRKFIEVTDEGVLTNLHDGESYEHLLPGHSLMKLHPDIRIRVAREKPFYGPGSHLLLRLTDETGSLREACRHMGISYTKGRALILRIEQQLGYPVIESRQGGKAGGNSVVTEQGKELIQNYTKFLEEVKDCINELFSRYFTS